MKVKYLLVFILFVLLLGLISFLTIKIINKENPNNIVIIDIDIMRGDSLSCNNNPNNIPNICAFAEKSIIFKHNIVTSFWTTPSMASTMTALFPSTLQYWGLQDTLDYITFPEMLRGEGYYTSFVDDSGHYTYSLGAEIAERGFDKLIKNLEIKDWKPYFQEREKSGPSLTYFYSSSLHDPYLYYKNSEISKQSDQGQAPVLEIFDNYAVEVGQYLIKHKHRYFTEKSLDHINILSSNAINGDVAEEVYKYYQSRTGNLDFIREQRAEVDFLNEIVLFENDKEIGNYMKSLYDKSLNQIDRELGDLLKYLASTSVSKNTIVVITSSHGEAFGEHKLYFHSDNLYNEILNTPLIIKTNKYKPKIINEISRNIDIFPTLFSLIGFPIPKDIQGSSLEDLLETGSEADKRYAFSQTNKSELAFSIQNKQWKLITTGNINSEDLLVELYSLEKDPDEKVNLSDDNLSKVDELLQEIKNILRQSALLRTRAPIPFPSLID